MNFVVTLIRFFALYTTLFGLMSLLLWLQRHHLPLLMVGLEFNLWVIAAPIYLIFVMSWGLAFAKHCSLAQDFKTFSLGTVVGALILVCVMMFEIGTGISGYNNLTIAVALFLMLCFSLLATFGQLRAIIYLVKKLPFLGKVNL